MELPSGTVTLLFTDIEGSTALAQRAGDRWPGLLAEHNRILREAFAAHGGIELGTEGDAFFAAFTSAGSATASAADAQRALAAHDWPDGEAVRVRIGLHTGEPTPTPDGFDASLSFRAAKDRALSDWERGYLTGLLRHAQGNLSQAARVAQMDRTHLRDLLRRYQIDGR